MEEPFNEHPIVPFRPHPLLRGGHAQTLAGVYWPAPLAPYSARRHQLLLADGDRIVLHDDCPTTWVEGDRTALLIHGLAGSHASGYMCRIAHKLSAAGIRAFRMDLRGCGAGLGLARMPYHSGRSEDAAAALHEIARLAPGSPATLLGFSLGANMTLKLLGELGAERCGNLDSALAVCPPVDLAACSRRISRGSGRLYDRFFLKLLVGQVSAASALAPHEPHLKLRAKPRSLWEFDDRFTAAVCGFGSADNYYREASSAQFVPRIQLPTLIIAARDDPMIPHETLEQLDRPSCVRLYLAGHGGHLGFLARRGIDRDRRWIDWRAVEWVLAQSQNLAQTQPATPP